MSSNNLPECLIVEIFSYLPVESVLRFRCASKSWDALLKSRCFILKHQKRNNDRPINYLMLQYRTTQAGELDHYKLCLDDTEQFTVRNMNELFNYSIENYLICGPCNGIYYLRRRSNYCHYFEQRCLWNPTFNEKKILPPLIRKPNIPSSIMEYYAEYFGFGFDPLTDDYKVVAIKGYKKSRGDQNSKTYKDYPLSIMIYSLKTDSWKYLGDLSKSYYLQDNIGQTFVDTCYYWLGSHGEYAYKYDIMISLDLSTEVWQEIRLPESRIKCIINENGIYNESLLVYHNSIALITRHMTENKLDVWTFKEKCWSNDSTIELGSIRGSLPLGHYYFANNNSYVVFSKRGRGLFFWDPKTKEILEFDPTFSIITDSCASISSYVESLIPLNDRHFWEGGTSPSS